MLEHIRQELPPSLNAQITSRTLTMDLDAARDFFDIDFRKSVFDMFRENKFTAVMLFCRSKIFIMTEWQLVKNYLFRHK